MAGFKKIAGEVYVNVDSLIVDLYDIIDNSSSEDQKETVRILIASLKRASNNAKARL